MKVKKISLSWMIIISLCLSFYGYAEATISPVQANARPFGLDIVDFVYMADSDTKSTDFYENYLPELNQIIDSNLNERLSLNTDYLNSVALDSSKLSLSNDSDLRIYFVGEGAGYHNTLGFNTEGGGVTSGDPQLIFPDASTSSDYLNPNTPTVRTSGTPLAQGDFANLGTISAGTELDFFLIANGAYGGQYVYSTDEDVNPDGIQHVVSFAIENSSYLLIGFEDLYNGGDMDFNDLLFAVDIGTANVQELIENSALVPEAQEIVLIVIFLLFLIRHLALSFQENKKQINY
ncbi:hypothetical protein LNTAR_08584 [Lentisphaera araneosa HTCC2155]|uniref:DUF4114 domain-containing protein n=1 Tax=Lentisphaera araneosa HTCC2155 TaxID=313628 RepID=A6DHV8_9BACT|nr:DUF4114 domain-containing protein [Lentisphaera araneosa]EDM28612.1 hypothetical protein LNTAR_08584 [Lentisphaera araneosa HTCC2155]